MNSSIAFCRRNIGHNTSLAFDSNDTIFSFYGFILLTMSSTPLLTINILIGLQGLLQTSCELSLHSLERSLKARFVSAPMLTISQDIVLAGLLRDSITSRVTPWEVVRTSREVELFALSKCTR